MLIDQQPHQLRHRNGGMGVIELNRIFAVKVADRQALPLENPEHVLQRATHKENLLTEPQPLALFQFVVGIEHLGEGFRLHLLQHGPGVIPGIERGKVKGIRGLGSPEPQGVGRVHAIAQDRGVIGHADDGMAANSYRVTPLRMDHLPGIASHQPRVGAFHLALGTNLLAKDAEFVANAIANGRNLQGGHRFLETGRQASKPPVAKAGFRFLGEQAVQGEAEGFTGLLRLAPQAQVDEIVFQVRAQQILGREIDSRAYALLGVGLGGIHPGLQQKVPHRQRQGEVVVVLGRQGGSLGQAGKQMASHRVQQRFTRV